MPSLTTAFRAFFKALFDSDSARRIAEALDSPSPAATQKLESPAPKQAPKPERPKKPTRSDAVALLELLQREARFIDFIMEDVAEYSDDQVGAAVRDVHRSCRTLVDRLFDIKPICDDEEGETITLEADYSTAVYRVVGKVTDQAEPSGEVLHRGWQVSKVSLPSWSGDDQSSPIVSPVEIEVA